MKRNIIKIVSGKGFRLIGNDIDTDRIIPARFLKCVTFDGLGEHAFEDDRRQLNGAHPFDQETNKDRSVLLVDKAFACGSSREHAVPAITQNGIEVIIGLSFSEIFAGNAVGNGLVCVTLEKDAHENLAKLITNYPDSDIEVDIENGLATATDADGNVAFCETVSIPVASRDKFLNGTWNDLVTCHNALDEIAACAARLPYLKVRKAG